MGLVQHMFAVITIVGILMGGGATAFASPYYVNDAGDVFDGVCDAAHCSIRDAVWASNNSSLPHIIQIAPYITTITLSRPCGGVPEDDNDCGDLDLWSPAPGSTVLIEAFGATTLTHSWAGVDAERLLHVPPAAEGRYPPHLIVENLSFGGGTQVAATGGPFGGGCVAQEGGMSLELRDAALTGCERQGEPSGSSRGGVAPSCVTCAAHGGGVYVVDGGASLNDCEFFYNEAAQSGGGLYAHGPSVEFLRVRAGHNVAHGGSGGGLHLMSDWVELAEVDVYHNDAHDDGGGALVVLPVLSQEIVMKSSFWKNRAGVGSGSGRGGGVAVVQRPGDMLAAAVVNTTFSQNEAVGSASAGGGLALLPASGSTSEVALWHTTFYQNEATHGTELHNATAGPISYKSSILWSNGVDACAGGGSFVTVGYNSFNSAHHRGSCDGDFGLDDDVHPVPLDPLTYAGSFTRAHPVLSGDTGRHNHVPWSPGICHAADQHGKPRPFSSSDCTVGALEY